MPKLCDLQPATQSAPTLAEISDRQVSRVATLIVDVVEAMSEDKCNFTPRGLNPPGSDDKGVITFAGQVKHAPAGNYFVWAKIAGEKSDEGWFNDGAGR